MRPGNPPGNYRQRPIALALVLEPVLVHEDRVGLPAPLTNQCRAGFQHGTRIEGKTAFFQRSGQGLQTTSQREARAATGAFLQLIGEGSDHQITAKAQRRSRAMQFAPSKPQLVRRPIDQPGNFVFELGRARVSRSVVPVVTSTENGRRPARILASRSVVDWGPHTLAGSAMR